MTEELFISCLEEKLARLRGAIHHHNIEAAVIQRRDNFAWLTTGGNNAVIRTDSIGVCAVIVNLEATWLIAKTMDADRLYEEEFYSFSNMKLVKLKWYEHSIQQEVLSILGTKRFVSDVTIGDTSADNAFFEGLHTPFNSVEITRYRNLGILAEKAMFETCMSTEPGMTEDEAFSILEIACARNGIENVVRLMGADDRPRRYKHCAPGEKRIENFAMFAAAFHKWGLNAPLSRSICFKNTPDNELLKHYSAACQIAAESIALCREGTAFHDISQRQKELFGQLGYETEWHQHFQGGLTGYIINNSAVCLDLSARVRQSQAFNWFITILGAKVEETTLALPSGTEMVTNTGLFPCMDWTVMGKSVRIPRILLR